MEIIEKEELELIYAILIKDEEGVYNSITKLNNKFSCLLSAILLNLYNKDNKMFDLHLIILIMDKEAEDKESNTMLYLAANIGLINVVTILLKNGLDPNVVNNSQLTLLHCATGVRNNEVIRILSESGAALDAQDEKGLILLHLAALAGHTDTVIELVRLGANKDIKAQDSFTALALLQKSMDILVQR